MGQALMTNTQREKVPLNLNIPFVYYIKPSVRFIRTVAATSLYREKASEKYSKIVNG